MKISQSATLAAMTPEKLLGATLCLAAFNELQMIDKLAAIHSATEYLYNHNAGPESTTDLLAWLAAFSDLDPVIFAQAICATHASHMEDSIDENI